MKRYNHSYLEINVKKDNRKRKLLFDWWLIRFSMRTVDDEGNVSTVRVILPLTEFLYKYYHYHNIREFRKQIETLRKVNPNGIEYMLDPNTLPAGIERDVLFIPVICPRYGYKWNRKQILNCFNMAPNSTLRILSPYLSFYWKNDLRNIFKKHFKNVLREINQHAKRLNEAFHPINITPQKSNSKFDMFSNSLYEELTVTSHRNVMAHRFLHVDVVV